MQLLLHPAEKVLRPLPSRYEPRCARSGAVLTGRRRFKVLPRGLRYVAPQCSWSGRAPDAPGQSRSASAWRSRRARCSTRRCGSATRSTASAAPSARSRRSTTTTASTPSSLPTVRPRSRRCLTGRGADMDTAGLGMALARAEASKDLERHRREQEASIRLERRLVLSDIANSGIV